MKWFYDDDLVWPKNMHSHNMHLLIRIYSMKYFWQLRRLTSCSLVIKLKGPKVWFSPTTNSIFHYFFFKCTYFFTLLVNAVNLLCLSFVVSFDLGQWQWGLLFFQVTCQQFCSCWSRPETGNSQLRPPGWRTIIFSFIDYLVLPCISKKDLKKLKFVPF